MSKVSVVVPVYNTSKYLGRCLDSLVNQTLNDIEIICVNDGSTDESLDILTEYASKYPQVKIVSHPNKGYGAAMNHGFDEACGDYIGIVESDDYADLNMFEELYSFATRNGADVVKSDYYQYRDDISIPVKTYPLLMIKEGRYDPYDYTDMFFEQRNWTGLYKRVFIESNGIRHNETKGASFQDVSFNFLVMCQAQAFYYLPKAFLHYRIDNPRSSIHSRNKTYALCDEMAYIEKYLDEHFTKADRVYKILANVRFRLYQRDVIYRIYTDDKYAFLERAVEEYKMDERLSRYEKEIWRVEEWENLMRVIRNTDDYLTRVKIILDKRIRQRTVFLNQIRLHIQVFIYGAGKVAKEIVGFLKDYGIKPDRVLVENPDDTPKECDSVLVCSYKDVDINREEPLVLIAVREQYLDQVEETLANSGYKKIIKMNTERRVMLCDYVEL